MSKNPTNTKNLSWREAAIEVLKASGAAMHYSDIASEILKQGLRTEVGATPAASVGAMIYLSLKNEADNSPFLKVDGGTFMLKQTAGAITKPAPATASGDTDVALEENLKKTAGIIKALGMFWRRDQVDWSSNPHILGQQLATANQVDFCQQRGVYLLHDGREVIYVGRTTDQPMGKRLNDHTSDRLNGRWDRFSWFGILKVTPEGKLEAPDLKTLSADTLIATMEAILIEGLEPRQNRKRGDALAAVEYLQVPDPALKKKQTLAFLNELNAKMLKG